MAKIEPEEWNPEGVLRWNPSGVVEVEPRRGLEPLRGGGGGTPPGCEEVDGE
jgi:hypothetical protein